MQYVSGTVDHVSRNLQIHRLTKNDLEGKGLILGTMLNFDILI